MKRMWNIINERMKQEKQKQQKKRQRDSNIRGWKEILEVFLIAELEN